MGKRDLRTLLCTLLIVITINMKHCYSDHRRRHRRVVVLSSSSSSILEESSYTVLQCSPGNNFVNIKELRLVENAVVNRGNWLWSLANIKWANKDAKIYVAQSFVLRSYTMHVSARSYWLVHQYRVNNYCVLCTVEAKKNIRQWTVSGFRSIPSINYDFIYESGNSLNLSSTPIALTTWSG